MKYLISLLFVVVSTYSFTQTEIFKGSFDELEQKAQKQKKPYIVDFSTSWCGYCKKFDREVMPDSSFSSLVNQQFLFGKVDGDAEKALVSKYKVRGYPTFIIFNEKGEEIKRFNGYVDAQSFVRTLNYLGYKQQEELVISLTKYEVKKEVQSKVLFEELNENDKNKAALRTKLLVNGNRELTLVDIEDYKITHPSEELYIDFYYDYSLNGFDIQKVQNAFSNQVISIDETHQLLVQELFQGKSKVDNDYLVLVNTLLLQEPTNYYFLDTKAYVYFKLGDSKQGTGIAKQAKKAAVKAKLDYSATEELLK